MSGFSSPQYGCSYACKRVNYVNVYAQDNPELYLLAHAKVCITCDTGTNFAAVYCTPVNRSRVHAIG